MTEIIKTQVRLYACGGGGVNIAREFEQHRVLKDVDVGFASLNTAYIDTSRSNLMDGKLASEHIYLIDARDGSGKVRKENHAEIAERVRHILQTHPPGYLNIVLSTTGGGSGSVIAPSLVAELLARGEPTVVLAVGSTDTGLETQNTLKTLQSYQGVAEKRQAPVVLHYLENSPTSPRSVVDKQVRVMITALCALFSRENRELDTQDLVNWLRFDKVTTFTPQLASLTLLERETQSANLGQVITVATLCRDDQAGAFGERVEYQCVGYFPEGAVHAKSVTTPMHFITSDGPLNEVAARLQSILADLERAQQARLKKASPLSSRSSTDDGLVL